VRPSLTSACFSAGCSPLLPPALPSPPCSPAGSFTPVAGSHECDVCEPGSFSNTTASSSCYKCLPGFITVGNGDAGATECTACGKGTFRAANATDNKCQR